MKQNIKKYAKLFLRIGISSVLILFLLWTFRDKKEDIIKSLTTYDPFYFTGALILLVLGTYMSSTRWRFILLTSKKDVSVKNLFVLYVKGYFYNNFLPTQMGGDLYKSIALGRRINDQSVALFSVFVDRFSGLVVLLAMSLFGLASLHGLKWIIIGFIFFIIGLLLYFPVLRFFSKKIHFLTKFLEASEMLVNNRKYAFLIIVFSVFVQTCSFAMVYVLFQGFGKILPLEAVIAYMPLASLSLLIPSFNGIGTQDVIYMVLFGNVGVTKSLSFSVSILVHVIRLLMSLFGGLLLLFNK